MTILYVKLHDSNIILFKCPVLVVSHLTLNLEVQGLNPCLPSLYIYICVYIFIYFFIYRRMTPVAGCRRLAGSTGCRRMTPVCRRPPPRRFAASSDDTGCCRLAGSPDAGSAGSPALPPIWFWLTKTLRSGFATPTLSSSHLELSMLHTYKQK